MSGPTPESTLFYTTDGSVPTTASAVYTHPLVTPSTVSVEVVRVMSVQRGILSPMVSAQYTIAPPLPAPTFTPGGGTYKIAPSVTLAASGAAREIYYTTDGSAPTTSSTLYTGAPIAVSGSTTIQAIAGARAGYSQSATASQTYNVIPATPFISPASNTYTSARTVTISDSTAGTTIYYTTDGSTPTTSSPVYSGTFSTVGTPATETVRAFAVLQGIYSSPTSATYTITPALAAPTFSPAQGTYTSNQSVTLSATAPGQVIYYTTDGSTPTAGSPVYAGKALIAGPGRTTIKAMVAAIDGYTQSPIAMQTYIVNPASPYLSPGTGTYTSARTVTITDSTPGVTIYYTVDGTTPTSLSPVYTGPIVTRSTSGTETVRAFAIAGGVFSAQSSATYTITPPLPPPTFSPAPGSFKTAQSVTLTAPSPDQTIYYTLDGTAPTTASLVYSGTPIAISAGRVVVSAMAGPIAGYAQSSTVSAAYSIIPATPFISPASGTYPSARSVKITDASAAASIYYTVDGSAPTVNSTLYTGTFLTVGTSATETVRAFAVVQGVYSSATSATYTITPPLPSPAFSPAPGGYKTSQSVTLTAPSPGQTIYYTTDGTAPTTSSSVYNGTPIPVTSGRVVITAMVAAVPGYTQSAPAAGMYSIYPAVPFLSPPAGTYTSARTVTISDATPGSTIYYTTDGSTPTVNSPVYSGSFSTPGTAATETVSAFAVEGGVYSAVTSNTYVIAPLPVVPTPQITPSTGTYSTTQIVSITDTVPGAVIFYTLDGSQPTGNSPGYNGTFSFPTNQTGTVVVKALAYAPNYQWSNLAESDITLSLPQGVIASTTVGTSPVDTIATNFLGYAHNWTTAAALVGDAALGVNNIYRTLLGTLATEMNGPMVVRIGGSGTDISGPATADTVEPFVELAQAENVSLILGVNLGSDDVNLAEEQAQVFTLNVPSSVLTALEIGNEPDGYSSNGLRLPSYDYTNFLSDYQQWYQGILSVAPGVTLAGPTFGTGYWLADAETDVADSALQAGLMTQHKYIACYYPSNPLPSDILLQPSSANASLWAIQPYVATAHQAHIPFRMDEINSICLGGQPGVSDTFSSALWAIDNMFEYANAGVDGVNWSTDGRGGAYDLFQFNVWSTGAQTLYALKAVRPLYYGLLFFAEAAGNTAQLLPSSTLTDSNIKVWVTTDSTGHAHLVVINKEQATSGSVEVTLPGYSTGSVVRLTASGYQATSGVSIGGQTYDGSTDGTLQGTPAVETLTPLNNVWTIPVDPTSAVLVNLQP